MSDNESNDQSFIIKLRGLPWTVTSEDILKFLDGVKVSEEDGGGVHLITYSRNSTRPNGEAFVVCASEDDYKKAFYYNKKNMGHRYIESKLIISQWMTRFPYSWILLKVFSARQEDFENIMRKQNIVQHDTVVKLRGLPWRVTEKEIEDFFQGIYMVWWLWFPFVYIFSSLIKFSQRGIVLFRKKIMFMLEHLFGLCNLR